MAITSFPAFLLALGFAFVSGSGVAAQTLTVQESIVVDYRPVVARVESGDTATARSRLQGVVTRLAIDEGVQVKAGTVVAVIVDGTLQPQLAALSERISGLQAQVRQKEADIARHASLQADGFYPAARLEEERTALNVLQRSLGSATAERRALLARQAEGQIKAPADARVTQVNVVDGAIVSPGETIARFATLDGIVRLSLPERHASQISEGGTVTLRLPSRSGDIRTATVIKVYPELRDGAVVADATVQGGLDALVGERVDVLVSVGERRVIQVPANYVSTRYGVDFVRVKVADRFVDAPVALAAPLVDVNGQLEVLSGLRVGDVITLPETRK
ncbi:efflux RND transporter periplasmic adaptor subunit [Hyphomonas johnsonii]|uniref:RND family efflux transporter MFP subunit n=1 Tax=Hyphomonas johnsonii MHS-2 TaxID=1280950 RepID=A0A059FRT8_9PROT|nr:efflux RND transporter periplasmic adaptor subunit [Hyphomonas johnsonii]KCZ93385.1 RND family efflux transporter MFP subunit [Hyphomonas johnsonii MHS-2]